MAEIADGSAKDFKGACSGKLITEGSPGRIRKTFMAGCTELAVKLASASEYLNFPGSRTIHGDFRTGIPFRISSKSIMIVALVLIS